MTLSHVPGVGRIPSADIAVPEHDRELTFYANILGTGSHPLWREDLISDSGTPIIGLGKWSSEYADLPLQWMPHVQVADVARSAGRAVDRGGRELMHQKDDRGQSQWAVLLDPNGAAFGIIPVVDSEATPPTSGGRIAWLDLTVSDAPATRDFYQDVVGWAAHEVEMEDADGVYSDYVLCTSEGNEVAGICHARGVNENLPPVWMICLPVGDLPESVVRARESGGEIVDSRKGSSGEYVYVVVRDPVGVCLALVPT